MDSVKYLASRGYSDLQIACLKYTLRSDEGYMEHTMFDGGKRYSTTCRNKGLTSIIPENNPCSSAKEYCSVMRSIARKARKDNEPLLGYWSASKEERADFKQMGFGSHNWEEWYLDEKLAKGLR